MMKKILFSFLWCCIAALCTAQNVGIGTATPNASAMLDISSNNKGLLMPRMTSAQRNAIVAPAKGLIVFDTNGNSYWYYNGTAWKELAGNNYNSDSALFMGQQAGSVASYNLTQNYNLYDSSGYLYDSGGPAGSYGNNENFVYTIYPFSYPMATEIIVLSNQLESPYDSLIITDGFGHRYVLLGTTTGTYLLFGTVSIRFKSNFANTLSGFAIRWNGVFPGTKNNYDTSQITGWYYNPAKNYMRGGVNTNNNWSPDSSGMYSFAFGNNTKATGNSSLAMGYQTTASGASSTVLGAAATASGSFSTAMGAITTASGYSSTALGYGTIASGSNSTAIGNLTLASVSNSTALGYGTIASGPSSTALGAYTNASGVFSTALGGYTKSKSYGGLSIGLYNDSTNAASATFFNPLNRIFQIGNGTADNARSNAVTVLQNGKVGIGLTSPVALLDVNGDASFNDKIILLRNGADLNHGLRFDATVNGPYLFGYDGGALGAYGYPNTLSWNKFGVVSILDNLTVKNGKGIIRSTDGTQKKELSTNVVVNVSLAVGASTSVNFTFPESFSASPDVYVGNVVSGAGGWAEVIMTVANVTTTGGTLYVHNSTSGTWNPNFTVKVIAIGPQ